MNKAFNRVGAALVAAFSAQQVLSFIKSSIDAFKESEIAIKKLDTALGKNSKSLQKFAQDLQKVTTFSDDATIEAMSLIAAFTKEEDKIKGLIKVTQDFATAKGTDLSSAADLVTKTFASSTNALARYGITVEGAAGSTERYNSVIKGLSVYLGQAEAQGKTLTGQLEILHNELNDQQEQIGKNVLPMWLELNKVFNFVTKAIFQGGLVTALKEVEKQSEETAEKTKILLDALGLTGPISKGTIGTLSRESLPWLKQQQDRLKEINELINAGNLNQTQYINLKKEESKIQKSLQVSKEEEAAQLPVILDLYEEILQAQREMDEDLLILPDWKPVNRRAGIGPAKEIERATAAFERIPENLMSAEDVMGNIASLSGQISSTLNIAGHTFVGQLTQAASIGYSILNIISGIISIFSFFSGGGVIGAFAGLEKGGRVRNLGGNISFTKIPSFAVGGSYSTPGYGGPMGGGYPVMVHKNETLDVYNAGQTSRMESKMDRLINAVLTTNVHVSKKGKGQLIEVPVYLDGKEIARASQKNVNRMSRRGVNLNEF